MPLQTTGAISLGDIQGEFGGANPISLSEYYSAASGIPASGAISIGDFYGAANTRDTTTTWLTSRSTSRSTSYTTSWTASRTTSRTTTFNTSFNTSKTTTTQL